MGKYSTEPATGAQTISTLGGDYALKWDDETQKPGRPSHCYHTLCIAKLRLTLAVVVHPGNETSGTHSRSMLAEYLAFVSAVKKPRLVRGDVSFGNESVIGDCEAADVRYLFKTKRSKIVRGVFRELLADPVAWRDSSGGWQCAERDVRLDSWEKARRMVFCASVSLRAANLPIGMSFSLPYRFLSLC